MKDKKGGNFRTKASLAREEKEACKEGVPGEEDEEGKAGHNDETAFTKKAKDANIFFSDMDLLARILSFLAADDLWGCARTNRDFNMVTEAMPVWDETLASVLGDSKLVTHWPLPCLPPLPADALLAEDENDKEEKHDRRSSKDSLRRSRSKSRRKKKKKKSKSRSKRRHAAKDVTKDSPRSSSLSPLGRFISLLRYMARKAQIDAFYREVLLSMKHSDFRRCDAWRADFESAAECVIERRFLRWDVLDEIVHDSAYIVTLRSFATHSHLTMFNRRALQSAVGSALPALRDWTSDRSGGAGTRRKGGRLDTALRDAESDSRSGHGGGFGGGFIRSFGREARRSYGDGGDYEDDDDDDEDIGIGREREGDRRRKETDAEGGEEKKDEVEMRHVVGLIGEKAYDRLRAWASTMTARLPSYLRFESVGLYSGCFAVHCAHEGALSIDYLEKGRVKDTLSLV